MPLAKRHVVLADGSEFDSPDRRGISISPDSLVEIVSDLAEARERIELAEAEQTLKVLKAKLAEEERVSAKAAEARSLRERREAATKATLAKVKDSAGTPSKSRHAWTLVPSKVDAGSLKAGSLKAQVVDFLAKNTQADTARVAAACPDATAGAVTACLDRFWKAGVVIKS